MTEKLIAAVIYPDFQILDATGPLEVFALTNRILGGDPAYRIVTAAREKGPVEASSGLTLMALMTSCFANASFAVMFEKIIQTIVDTLMPPLSPTELTAGYILASTTRGLFVGLAVGGVGADAGAGAEADAGAEAVEDADADADADARASATERGGGACALCR